MNLQISEAYRRKRPVRRWLKQRLTGMYRYDVGLWRFAVVGIWLMSSSAAAAAALGMPTGFGAVFDMLSGIILNTLALALCATVATALLALTGWRIPRFSSAVMLYSIIQDGILLYFSEFNALASIIIAIVITSVAAFMAVSAGVVANRYRRTNPRKQLALLAALITICIIIYMAPGSFHALLPMTGADTNDAGTVTAASAANIVSDDPSKPGHYSYRYFTYGSGEDRHRAEFSKEAELLSVPVDASAYIKDWSWLRSKFWGFDETKLPMNGRVWMPEGAGPYPLVVMVHGNHLMEQFSDEGYAYLGQLLASRGMAAVSIDENFLNYSVWSGIPEEEMGARAWLLLKHIQQIQTFSRQKGSPFYGRIDFKRIALLGHSRGGQAAAMAADREQWFNEDSALPERDSYSVQAVIALAPTDTLVDGKRAELEDINFLTIQGAKDSDVVDFNGDRIYGRTTFPRNTDGFKAALYIEDANHSQFNTEWDSDLSFPTCLFIHPGGQLGGDEQRRIAKVYVGAFLETVFHGSTQYDSLFRDYRAGLRLLPSTRYYSQYQNGKFQRIADFEGNDRYALSPAASAEAMNMLKWQHVESLNRQREGKGNKGVMLQWRQAGSYAITVKQHYFRTDTDSVVSFSMADLRQDVKQSSQVSLADLSVEVELEDTAGIAVRLPLKQFMDIEPLPVTDFTWLPVKDSMLLKDRYHESSEPVFQTYELPLSRFHEANTRFDPAGWTKLTLYFGGGPGKVMLDEFGVMP